MTYAFGCLHGLGEGGSMVGNPSVSEMVSRAGETATSAKAITANWDLKDYTPGTKKKDEDQWGGPRARQQLHLAFTLAFSCLLRVDEVLKIQSHDIVLLDDHTFELTLPFRKTSQFGDIKPFVLHEMLNDSMTHLCAVQAYAQWLDASHIESGYIFRRLGSGDRVSENNQPMMAKFFLEMWSIRKICKWGGWSDDFSHLTIVKYLISWNDDPTQKREDFFNFNHAPALKCFACGRTCHCS
ncbi:DNA breaking-rejoining enzyme [Lactarius hatsudake]|nr:DNA breaking-rejoining enzyme [Lactarius hatsudake]